MFEDWKKSRDILRKIDSLQKRRDQLNGVEDSDRASDIDNKINDCLRQREGLETDRLIRRVRRLGIELPWGKKTWWWDDLDYVGDPYDVKHYLTDTGKAGVLRLIREEKRKNAEWWVKVVIVPLITALTGLGGIVIGVLAVLYR